MKLIIAGSRTFNNYELLKSKVDALLINTNQPIEIISGTAIGGDKLGERYAKERGHGIKQFPADWERYGKGAGFIRNRQMAEYATHCIIFWDGLSKGTKMMIDLARQYELTLRVVLFDNKINQWLAQ